MWQCDMTNWNIISPEWWDLRPFHRTGGKDQVVFTLLFLIFILLSVMWSFTGPAVMFILPTEAAMRAFRILFDIQSAGCASRDSWNEITKIQWKLNRWDADVTLSKLWLRGNCYHHHHHPASPFIWLNFKDKPCVLRIIMISSP